MKKFRIVNIVFVLVLLVSMFSGMVVHGADAESDVIVRLQINNPMMEVNGAFVEIDAGRGTTPVIVDGRTLVPIRAIIEAFGGTVGWEDHTQSVILTMADDTIRLAIDSCIAYLNGETELLDVAPTVRNARTMLPLRFVAECFNLGVAWDANTQSVFVIRDTFTDSEYVDLMQQVPHYSGQAFSYINNNVPLFETYEIITGAFEYYGNLDALGRCDVCFATVATQLMPSGERESISAVTPTGWINAKYDVVSGGYLYNRCHLIGYQLTGENANERNLITGTRYLNMEGMLPFENQIADYIERTGNQVVYRVTPVFSGGNLLADGVLLEAYSVEDGGQGLAFCVYCYNVQPQINIDYATGASALAGELVGPAKDVSVGVYRTPSGKRYHFDAQCGGKNSYEITMDAALLAGLTPCSKCVK